MWNELRDIFQPNLSALGHDNRRPHSTLSVHIEFSEFTFPRTTNLTSLHVHFQFESTSHKSFDAYVYQGVSLFYNCAMVCNMEGGPTCRDLSSLWTSRGSLEHVEKDLENIFLTCRFRCLPFVANIEANYRQGEDFR
jgi:hypothetical protein